MANLKIKNLSLKIGNIEIFKNLNFTLRKDKTLSIIGTTASGKTTLLKILNGELEYNGQVLINGIEVCKENFDALRKCIAVVYTNSLFLTDTVIDELKYSLEQMNISPQEIKKRVLELNEYFDIKRIINKKIDVLSLNDRTLVKILSYAIMEPSYIAIDDLLIDLNERTKILLLNYLNSKKILLIQVTSDMEDVLYTDYTMCLYNGISAIDGKTLDVIQEEKILKRLGFSLPFMVDLSIQLQLYGLISKIYLNKEAMVKNLWK